MNTETKHFNTIGRTIVSEADVDQVIAQVFKQRNLDFSGYTRASFSRRIQRIMDKEAYSSISTLLDRVSGDDNYYDQFLKEVTVNVTEMFRDPTFFKALREQVLPALAHKDRIKIWHCGCSSGEEIYSMAVIVEELGLLNKTVLYGTDLNSDVLEKAKTGIYPASLMREYTRNYLFSGGSGSLSDHYVADYGNAIFKDKLRKRMVFSQHNLVTDGSFNEFDVILCRNVMIYFTKSLQARVIRLFTESLSIGGFLGLGSKESLLFAKEYDQYDDVNAKEKIYRRIK